jgi:hypothetical protein
MKIEKLFKLKSYKGIVKLIQKSFLIRSLERRRFDAEDISSIWTIKGLKFLVQVLDDRKNIQIFGKYIDLNAIEWHKDYCSGFTYSQRRFDRIKLSDWFDKGIDVKYPWELSRFYFGITIAQNFTLNGEPETYQEFKKLIIDWIRKNPFCYGVNWKCSMEIAIRAVNWIIAINLFGPTFIKDNSFKEKISISLQQHAEYISSFPEIYEKGHTTNHTTADYMGLLFIALALRNHGNSKKWLTQAVDGLELCIRYQTYDDGVNFEASIPYHRLVLEMFAYSAIVAISNNVEFTEKYYELLFKMFEYSAAYMDENGNVPQVGDNDSGRVLIFDEISDQNHSYLLDIGEHIFDYTFRSQCEKRDLNIKSWLPGIEKIDIGKLNIEPRKTDKSIGFKKGGSYFLKADSISLMVTCQPPGQNGIGGHNHYDIGSYTVSINGIPIIVDPGTYTYTRDYAAREYFRSPECHNVIVLEQSAQKSVSGSNIWKLNKYQTVKNIEYARDRIEILIADEYNGQEIKRIISIESSSITIIDSATCAFKSYMHLYPTLVPKINAMRVELGGDYDLKVNRGQGITALYYDYSEKYNCTTESKVIAIDSDHDNQSEVVLICK